MVHDPEVVVSTFVDHNKQLLGSSKPTDRKLHQAVIEEGELLSDDQKNSLYRAFSVKDVKLALWSIDDDKALGPNGFSSKFFKDSWDIVKDDLCKVEDASCVSQYRSIACCNVVYKLISKLLCYRLKEVLFNIMSENQGTFVGGRSILDNILVCQDMLKNYNNKRKGRRCTTKVDLRKAYNSVLWFFIRDMQEELDFPSRFISWVMECI
uniref:Reverse transcriptase domain-containing protein n=1 Tax=Chenopodium quinoa TaxID=63459 RepID=A0A803NBD5_CHEQI